MEPSDTLVVFDVGGVLAKLDYGAMLQEYSRVSGRTLKVIRNEMAGQELDKYRNLGQEPRYLRGVRDILRKNLPDTEIQQLSCLSVPDQVGDVVALKERLHKAGYTIGILSVISETIHQHCNNKWPQMLETWNGPQAFSYQMRVLKPDPRSYEPLHGIRKNTVFIDDKSTYLAYPVEHLGWEGIELNAFLDPNELMRTGTKEATRKWPVCDSAASLEKALQVLGVRW